MTILNKTVDAIGNVNLANLRIFDLENKNPFYNIVIIGTGTSRQSDALIGYLKDELKNAFEIKGVEGKQSGWLLIDLGDIIIHIFDQENRSFYNFDDKFMGFNELTEQYIK